MSTASSIEREMLALINEERTSRGLEPLELETRLNDSSEDHSEWMLDTDTFSHTGSGGTSATQRMEMAGFDFSGNWRSGENIAWQSERGAPGISDDVVQLHENLMNSPGHRANILNPDFKYIGIGIETGDMQGFDAVMVTQNFATTEAAVMLDTSAASKPPTETPESTPPSTPTPVAEAPSTENPETPTMPETPAPTPVGETPGTNPPTTPGTDNPETPTSSPTDGTPNNTPTEPDCFDFANISTEIEAFIRNLQTQLDQFDWNPQQATGVMAEADDFMIAQNATSQPEASDETPEYDPYDDFFAFDYCAGDFMMEAA